MRRKRIAIACQGGGSQCAFVAGALKALFAHRVDASVLSMTHRLVLYDAAIGRSPVASRPFSRSRSG